MRAAPCATPPGLEYGKPGSARPLDLEFDLFAVALTLVFDVVGGPDGDVDPFAGNLDLEPVAVLDGVFVDGMTWGAQTWWYPADLALEPYEDMAMFDCPGALAPRLVIGGRAVVLPGAPNRIRSTPSTGGTFVTQIPSGETFDVLGGPECADGIVWWQVSYGSATGWTAEGVDAYFVEPLR